jgi:hypothetical protein
MAVDQKKRYASRAIVNMKDDNGTQVRGLHVSEFTTRSSAPLKRVNVMAKEPVSQGFTQGTEECSGSLKLPRHLWRDQYDFDAARRAGRTLTFTVVTADGRDFGQGEQVIGVRIEEVSKGNSESGDNDISVTFQAIEVRPDLSRRPPF